MVLESSPTLRDVVFQSTVTGLSSEDCLTLNVFRPAGTSVSAALPVMVWIYGGGFQEGQTSIYNATEMIVQSVARVSSQVFISSPRLYGYSHPDRERLSYTQASITASALLGSHKATRRPRGVY